MNQQNLDKAQKMYLELMDMTDTTHELVTLMSVYFINTLTAVMDEGIDKPSFDHDADQIFKIIKDRAFAQIQDLKGTKYKTGHR